MNRTLGRVLATASFTSSCLRWLLVKSASESDRPKRLGLVDLARAPSPAGHHEVYPLPPEVRDDAARSSDDGRWIELELEGYRKCVLPLALPLQRDGQHIPLDAQRLLHAGRRLASGRGGAPAAPEDAQR